MRYVRKFEPAKAQLELRAPHFQTDRKATRSHRRSHPLLGWRRGDVDDYVRIRGDELHEAYRLYGSTRVSCAFCVLGSEHDLLRRPTAPTTTRSTARW